MFMLRQKGLVVLLVFATVPLWSQVQSSGALPAGEEAAVWSRGDSPDEPAGEDAPMATPTPFSGEGYSLDFAVETPRTNYLLGRLGFGTAYDDNVLPSSGQSVGDVAYSIWPSLALQQSRSRLRWNLNYTPGYTVHQRLSSVNGFDHDLAVGFQYRLSPHVTLNVADTFQKSPDLLGLQSQNPSISGPQGVNGPNDSIVPPGTVRISNFSDATLTYQFGPNAMIGARGTLSGLWYPDRAEIPGLYDSTGESATGFYSHRLSGRNSIGASYGFQRILTHDQAETQTQNILMFYTVDLPPHLALSIFAGPEHSDTHSELSSGLSRWTPAAGASLSWRGEHHSFVASYEHRISDGGGLSGASIFDRAEASARWQLARTLTATIGGGYSTNSVLESQNLSGFGGHTWSGTASLQHPLGEMMSLQMGYTRLHQSYSSISTISEFPDRNYVWVSLSYQFQRPLGR